MPSIAELKTEVKSLRAEIARVTGEDDQVALVVITPDQDPEVVVAEWERETGKQWDPDSGRHLLIEIAIVDNPSFMFGQSQGDDQDDQDNSDQGVDDNSPEATTARIKEEQAIAEQGLSREEVHKLRIRNGAKQGLAPSKLYRR